MHYMVVIGKAHPFTVRAKDMHMAAAAQRSWRIRRGNIHRIKVTHLAAFNNHSAPMMEVVMPCFIRIFRAVDEDILL